MSTVKSPTQKKSLAYDREHVSPSKNPHAFRKTWPRKKARAERELRRAVRQKLRAAGDDAALLAVRRTFVRKWENVSLRESVARKQKKRVAMIGAHKARKAKRSAIGFL